jgi:flagellar protein FlaG
MTLLERTNLEVMPAIKSSGETKSTASKRQTVAVEGQIMPQKSDPNKPVSGSADNPDLNEVVKTVADFVQNIAREINFSVNEDSGDYVVTVTDRGTGEVIRQIPREEMIQISEHLAEFQKTSTGLTHKGILFDSDV